MLQPLFINRRKTQRFYILVVFYYAKVRTLGAIIFLLK